MYLNNYKVQTTEMEIPNCEIPSVASEVTKITSIILQLTLIEGHPL